MVFLRNPGPPHTDARWRPLPHIVVGGLKVALASRAELADAAVADCLAARSAGHTLPPRVIADSNGHALSLRMTDVRYRQALEDADVVHADGASVVVASRLRWRAPEPVAERSSTTDMIHDLALAAERHGLSFYLLGGAEEVNAGCAMRLSQLYPRLAIAGRRNGYFGPEEEAAVIAGINTAAPDILWVGLGKPAEQLFAARNKGRLKAGWVITCGGCFNYVTGRYKRAPRWMQAAGLEWLHRMATEPRKLFWRYLVTTPHALWLLAVAPGREK